MSTSPAEGAAQPQDDTKRLAIRIAHDIYAKFGPSVIRVGLGELRQAVIDAAAMKRKEGEEPRAAQPQVPKFNLETLEGRKAAWAWLVSRFGNSLIVTKDGIPFEDQTEGIRQFKNASRTAQPQEWTVEPCVSSVTGREWSGLSYIRSGKHTMGSVNTEVAKAIVSAHNATLQPQGSGQTGE